MITSSWQRRTPEGNKKWVFLSYCDAGNYYLLLESQVEALTPYSNFRPVFTTTTCWVSMSSFTWGCTPTQSRGAGGESPTKITNPLKRNVMTALCNVCIETHWIYYARGWKHAFITCQLGFFAKHLIRFRHLCYSTYPTFPFGRDCTVRKESAHYKFISCRM